jgi:hypothetical protein
MGQPRASDDPAANLTETERNAKTLSHQGHSLTVPPHPTNWLRLAQAAWVLLLISVSGFYVYGLALEIRQPSSLCMNTQGECTEAAVEAALARYGLTPRIAQWLIIGLLEIVVPVGSMVMATFIVWRRPDRLISLAVAGMLMLNGPAVNTGLLQRAAVEWNVPLVARTAEFFFLVFVLFVIYTFPSGNFIPRWAGWLMGLGVAGHMAVAVGTGTNFSDVNFFSLVSMVLGLGFQVYRYRRVATPTERQQSKWVVAGLAAFFLNAVLYFGLVVPASEQVATLPLLFLYLPLNAVLVLALPAALMLASLRYRLWDIDVIIRRTLVYALLTGLLTMTYLGLVVVLQNIAGGLTGQRDSALVTVLSTLGIAAMFAPLRRSVQRFVDRRFYRRKYDTGQTLAAFAARSRDEVDIDKLVGELRGAVDETMQPEHLGVWLKGE